VIGHFDVYVGVLWEEVVVVLCYVLLDGCIVFCGGLYIEYKKFTLRCHSIQLFTKPVAMKVGIHDDYNPLEVDQGTVHSY